MQWTVRARSLHDSFRQISTEKATWRKALIINSFHLDFGNYSKHWSGTRCHRMGFRRVFNSITPPPSWLLFPSSWHHALMGQIDMLACLLSAPEENKSDAPFFTYFLVALLIKKAQTVRSPGHEESLFIRFFSEKILKVWRLIQLYYFPLRPSIMDWPDWTMSLSLCRCLHSSSLLEASGANHISWRLYPLVI